MARNSLSGLVDAFSAEMRGKLMSKRRQGWTGWQEPERRAQFVTALMEHIGRALDDDPAQWIDVANYAAFLWRIDQAAAQEKDSA